MSVFIRNVEGSISHPNIFVAYDRTYKNNVQWLYLNYDSEIYKYPIFYSELEVRDWLDCTEWISRKSNIFVLELPTVESTQILLSNDPEKTLVVIADSDFLEALYNQQYGVSNGRTR